MVYVVYEEGKRIVILSCYPEKNLFSKLVNNEAQLAIIHIRIVNQAGD